MADQQQRPDGSWGPAESIGWQGNLGDLDWEVSTRDGRLVAEGLDRDKLVYTVRARNRLTLALKGMWLQRRYRRRIAADLRRWEESSDA